MVLETYQASAPHHAKAFISRPLRQILGPAKEAATPWKDISATSPQGSELQSTICRGFYRRTRRLDPQGHRERTSSLFPFKQRHLPEAQPSNTGLCQVSYEAYLVHKVTTSSLVRCGYAGSCIRLVTSSWRREQHRRI